VVIGCLKTTNKQRGKKGTPRKPYQQHVRGGVL
jgi:hypothetical protein